MTLKIPWILCAFLAIINNWFAKFLTFLLEIISYIALMRHNIIICVLAHHATTMQQVKVIDDEPKISLPFRNHHIDTPIITATAVLKDIPNKKYVDNQNKLRCRYHSRKKR